MVFHANNDCTSRSAAYDLVSYVSVWGAMNKGVKSPCYSVGAQWLSGRVLDSRPRGHRFEPHRRHCVASLSKIH